MCHRITQPHIQCRLWGLSHQFAKSHIIRSSRGSSSLHWHHILMHITAFVDSRNSRQILLGTIWIILDATCWQVWFEPIKKHCRFTLRTNEMTPQKWGVSFHRGTFSSGSSGTDAVVAVSDVASCATAAVAPSVCPTTSPKSFSDLLPRTLVCKQRAPSSETHTHTVAPNEPRYSITDARCFFRQVKQ